MPLKVKLTVAVLMVIAVAILLAVVLVQRSVVHRAKVVYLCTLDADQTSLTFWASNPNPTMIVVNVGVIEVRDGTNWRPGPIWTETSLPASQTDSLLSLLPHSTAQKQMTAAALLQSSSWRLKVIEADVLAGPERYIAGLRMHLRGIAPPAHSFAMSSVYYGHHREVIVCAAEKSKK